MKSIGQQTMLYGDLWNVGPSSGPWPSLTLKSLTFCRRQPGPFPYLLAKLSAAADPLKSAQSMSSEEEAITKRLSCVLTVSVTTP